MNALGEREIPSYLREPSGIDHVYGVLKYSKSEHLWIIEGDPIVIQMAKRLFPGSEGRFHGIAKFPANKRSTGDLNWLMQRFPLKIEDEETWRRLRNEAIEHVLKRKEINERPQKLVPPPSFVGELKDFQKEGLAFLVHNERALLADDMGLGKTVTSIAWLATLQAWPALIVVQPHNVIQWKREVTRFLDFKLVTSNNVHPLKKNEVPQLVHVITGLRPYDLPPRFRIHHPLPIAAGLEELPPQFWFQSRHLRRNTRT